MKKVKTFALVLILVAGFGFSNLFGQEKESPVLYAVMFHADFCGACKAIAPKVMGLQTRLDNKKIEFVKFDFTNQESKQKTREVANKLGLDDVLASNQGTGFVVIVDAKSKKQKAVLTPKQSSDEMLAVVDKNL